MAKTEVIIEIDADLLEQAEATNLPLGQIAEHALRVALAAIERGEDWRKAIAANPWRGPGLGGQRLQAPI